MGVLGEPGITGSTGFALFDFFLANDDDDSVLSLSNSDFFSGEFSSI